MRLLFPLLLIIFFSIMFPGCKNRKGQSSSTEFKNKTENASMVKESEYIHFASGSFRPDNRIIASDAHVEYSEKDIVAGKIVKVIQFDQLPDNAMKSQMSKEGIELLDYIPKKAFIALLPKGMDYNYLKSINVSTISDYRPEMKMDKFLAKSEFPDYAIEGKRRRINIYPFKKIELESLKKELLKKDDIEVLGMNQGLHHIEILIPESHLETLASISIVKFLELGYPDPIPDKNNE